MEVLIICSKCPKYRVGVCALTNKRVKKDKAQCREGIFARIEKGIQIGSDEYNKNKAKGMSDPYTAKIFQVIRILNILEEAYYRAPILEEEDMQMELTLGDDND